MDMLEAVQQHADWQSELRRVFELCDEEKRGYIGRDTLVQLGMRHFGGSPEAMAEMVECLDPKKRGVITFEDFCRGVAAFNSTQGKSPRSLSPESSPRTDSCSPTAEGELSSLRAQSPTDSGLGERAEERFECEEEEDLKTNNLSSSKRLGNSLGRELSSATAVANASLNSNFSRRSSFSYDDASPNDMDSFADQQVVDDLTDKVTVMEMHMSALSDDLSHNKDLYNRVKQENSGLTQRIHSLEETLRELEIRSEERLREEKKHFREIMERKDRERSSEVDQYVTKLFELQQEHMRVKEECIRLRNTNDTLKQERKVASDQCQDAQQELATLKHEYRTFQELARKEREEFLSERNLNTRLMQELSQQLEEVQRLRANSVTSNADVEEAMRARSQSFMQQLPVHYDMIEKELDRMRIDNNKMRETNEELQAQLMSVRIEKGHSLMNPTASGEGSWAMESNNLVSLSKDELLDVIRKEKESNQSLRQYVGDMLSNIMEHYPQLLEKQ